MKLFRPLASTLFISLTLPAAAEPAEQLVTSRFREVRELIDAQVSTHGANHVLVAFDVDNTILATETDFGSEQWFQWQSQLTLQKPRSPDAIAQSFEDLVTIQSWIFSLSHMHAVESRIPTDVKTLTSQGVHFMVITSRGTETRDATLRELNRNGLTLTTTAPGPKGGFASAYLPFNLKSPEIFGITRRELAQLNVNKVSPVLYHDGIMLTGGQHKGVMLRTLLAKTKAKYKSIVFVDDRPHHLEGMQAAFAERPEAVSTVQYIYEKPRIEAFGASDKSAVKKRWCALSKGLVPALYTGGKNDPIPLSGCRKNANE